MKIFGPQDRTGWRRFLGWQWLLGLVVLVGLGAWGLSELHPPAPPPPPPKPAETAGRMETLSLTEIVEGDKRWVLEAKHADFDKDLQVKISGVKVEFFGPGEHVSVKADEGLFNTKTRVLTLKGQVEMQRGELQIKTNLATYEPSSRVLTAPEDVLLTDPTLRVQGKDLRVDLADKKLVLAQHRLTEIKVQQGMLKR